MKLEKINKKKQDKRNKNLELTKKIIIKHHTKSIKKLQGFLVEEHGLAISESTLKRYLRAIKKEKNKKIKIAEAKNKKIETEKAKFPYTIKDPSGKEHKIMGNNQTISIGWGESGQMIYYDTKDKLWRYESDHKAFDKNKKHMPYHRVHSISYGYDDFA